MNSRVNCVCVKRPAAKLAARAIMMIAATAIMVLSLHPGWPAPAAKAQSAGKTGVIKASFVRPGNMNMGSLLLQSTEPGQFIEAPRLATDVRISVTGIVARAVVTQRFHNPSKGWVEGIYVFPLPERAAVDTLKLQIGSRFIEGKIKPREEARKIYEEAKKKGKKASLVEQQRPNVFTNAVANIGPGETVVVQIEYQERLIQDNGRYALRFPLVVAPRYTPGKPGAAKPLAQTVGFKSKPKARSFDFEAAEEEAKQADKKEHPSPDNKLVQAPVLHPSQGKTNPVFLEVSLNAGFPLGDIQSPHHGVQIKRIKSDQVLLALKDGTVPADKDFELTWQPKAEKAPKVTAFKERHKGEDYVLAMISPPSGRASSVRPAREVIFVIDNSGSMAGSSMRQAKGSLLSALDRLTPEDKFNVIRFDHTFEKKFVASVAATPDKIAEAKSFVSHLKADGGTEMLPALLAALHDPATAGDTRLRQIIFLTDGAISNERQLFAEIATKRGRSRVFTVGIGSAPNSHFMRRASELGRGTFTHIGSARQVKARMSALLQKLERPQMTDIAAKWQSNRKVEALPNPIPDLYAGEPIVVAAKASRLAGILEISGLLEGKTWTATLNLDKAKTGQGIAKLWARDKIAQLEARRYAGQNWKKVDKSIENTALEHHLVSRMTSLVAVDVTQSRPAGKPITSRDVPLNLPEGWDFGKVFGIKAVPSMQQPQDAGLAKTIKVTSVRPQPDGLAKTSTRGINLPQTATTADRKIMMGILALVFTAMCTLTILLWRHMSKAYARPRKQTRRRL